LRMASMAARLPVFMNDRAAGHDTRMLASAAEVVPATDAIAALDQVRAMRRTNLPRQHAFDGAEQTPRSLGFEKCGKEAARSRDHREPADRALDSRKFFDHAHLAQRVELAAAVDARCPHTEYARFHQLMSEQCGKSPFCFYDVRCRLDFRLQ